MAEKDSSRERTIDKAAAAMLRKAKDANIETCWDRFDKQSPSCKFGSGGVCCRICAMGPCRMTPKADKGVCGATGATIAARNFCRMIAAGTAAHSDHARAVAQTFLEVARGEISSYQIKDETKLVAVAESLGVETKGKTVPQIAEQVGLVCAAQFGQQDGELAFIKRAPKKRQDLWRELGIVPRGIDREVVEMMHRTSIGVDQDPRSLILQGSRCALADGWGGSMVATELQDIMFGTPVPLRSKVNLGVLKEDEVNIVVHGHEPLLSEMLVVAARDKEMLELARSKGAKGINLAGICCTANEILMRHGIPIAGNMLSQELAVMTGAVDAMIVDVQCVMAGLMELTKCFHTKLISTNPKANIQGSTRMEFHEKDGMRIAKEIVRAAIENYPKRGKTEIPKESTDLIAGFSHETINYMLGGSFRGSYRPLNDNIMNGRILGIAGVVGCNNPKVTQDFVHVNLVKELIANNVLVVQTGCAAIACAKEGLLTPEAAFEYAGEGLREVCETVGIPPVLHSGSCVDNSRILIATTAMVTEGGLGNDISDLPVAGCAPEWMSEKAIAIGQYFVASGALVVFGATFPTLGSQEFTDLLFKESEEMFKGRWAFEPDPHKMAGIIIDHINSKRQALGIQKKSERVLFDMEMRRKLEF